MSRNYTLLAGADKSDLISNHTSFSFDILSGLTGRPKRLPPKYFYDDQGSILFDQITAQPEYYVTRCEQEIIDTYHKEIIRHWTNTNNAPLNLIELGAGFSQKTLTLIQSFIDHQIPFKFIPIDVSQGAMISLLESLEKAAPLVPVHGLVGDYSAALRWLKEHEAFQNNRNIVLFLGSSLGNFSIPESKYLLKELSQNLRSGDHMFIGFDLKKHITLLEAAYNDSQGVTRDFNLNLLQRINRELGANFVIDQFVHHGIYNAHSGGMDSFLLSQCDQVVTIEALGQSFDFHAWEALHTEYSHKYSHHEIKTLADCAGFSHTQSWYDAQEYFTDVLWTKL